MKPIKSFKGRSQSAINWLSSWHWFLLLSTSWYHSINCSTIHRSREIKPTIYRSQSSSPTTSIALSTDRSCSGKIDVVNDNVLLEQSLSLFRSRISDGSIKFFWTENTNSQYNRQGGLSFSLVAVIFGSVIWQPQSGWCVRDPGHRQTCIELADRLSRQANTLEAEALTQEWNSAFQRLTE
ncbi:hypothetical protein CROQUDRAFT_98560 [Cronartium quercuum f. sp. fusiforme G11]|uniref:Uncharacterized protein n=1 Tax=Cronartium quercuum f. sp. fusiforme G11 TaxID=708437 RepID=A0A9P6T778_9BASI|nr:hypothetical protein CROQUDRAFT_98560 [Cronartium quercuum f. sp. fusiforme G11]